MFVRIVILVAAAAIVVGLAARPSGSAGSPVSYVVRPSDTLWSIATTHYAGDPREGVWKLRQRNQLAGTLLVPGQRLVLP